MKTVGVIRLDSRGKRHAVWSEFPNSLPVGATISIAMGDAALYFFIVDHVHIAADQDVRVLCLKLMDDYFSHDIVFLSFAASGKWNDLDKAILTDPTATAVWLAFTGWDKAQRIRNAMPA